VYDYAALTFEQAQQLAGRTVRVRANITDPDPECAGAGEADDVQRWVTWRRGDETADDGEMIVEGRLSVRYIPPYIINGELVEGFYRLRLEAARPIRDPDGDD
jgi:hypothetical protein